ncbi:MAG: hypothetical protein JJE42_12570, partial [Burkholderiales bacterium]|nr:hypothetical protein [Burkholderiales bacterium]
MSQAEASRKTLAFAALLLGAAAIAFAPIFVRLSDTAPGASAFWRVVSEHRVNALFTAPTAVRAIKREDPSAELTKNFDLSSLRALFL